MVRCFLLRYFRMIGVAVSLEKSADAFDLGSDFELDDEGVYADFDDFEEEDGELSEVLHDVRLLAALETAAKDAELALEEPQELEEDDNIARLGE